MSTPDEPGPHEPGPHEPGGQVATTQILGPRETRRARVGRRVRVVARHRATAIVGAALVGLLVGGGAVATFEGATPWGNGGGYRGHHGVMHQFRHGHGWFGDKER